MYWLHYNHPSNTYFFRYQTDMTTYEGVYAPALIEVDVLFSDFTDKNNFYHEFNKSVVIEADSSGSAIWDSFILGICQIGYNGIYTGENTLSSIADSIYGDIILTVDGELDDNVVVGTISNDFIKVQKEEIDLFDSNNCNIYSFYTNPYRKKFYVEGWGSLNFVQRLIQERFQIYNKVRREITSDIISTLYLKPFALVDTTFGKYETGSVSTYYSSPNIYRLMGVGTTFLTTFVVGDKIIVENERVHVISYIYDDDELAVSTAWEHPGVSGLWYAKGKTFYVNGFRFSPNEVVDIFTNLNLKEYVDDDGITS
jgi:hypothetical protein